MFSPSEKMLKANENICTWIKITGRADKSGVEGGGPNEMSERRMRRIAKRTFG